MFISSLAQTQSGDLFNSADSGLVFGKILPILFVEMQHVQKRREYGLEVLFVRLIGRQTRLEFGACLGRQTFAINLQNLCDLLRNDILLTQVRRDTLGLSFEFASSAKLLSLCLGKFRF